MELIIKPTEACNFKCTFCSSTNITEDKAARLNLERVWQFLERYPNTNTIIVNGGDPLMVPPSYYWEIIKWLDDHNYSTTISLTTNLWAFYKNPDKWQDLLKHKRIGVATSFNYGETRRVTAEQNYTEELFWKVSDLFLERIGYRPHFISVITEENEDTAIDNVLLAKRMGVECKLNYAMASGIQGKPYQLSKIYKTYVEIYDQGLWPWEFNTKQMMNRLNNSATCCPQNRSCDDGIRAMNPMGDYYSCGSMGDDMIYPISFHREMKGEFITPLRNAPELLCMKDECLTCPMFEICNGCKKTIRDQKMHNIVEEHCTLMKQIAPRIIEINNKFIPWLIISGKRETYKMPLIDLLLDRKRDPEQEYTLHLFEYCNLRCGFCWQDHENTVGIDTVISKLAPIEEWLKTETQEVVVFNAMGGEVFAPEIFNEQLLQAYKDLSLGIRDLAAKYNKKAKVNWVSNLVTTKYSEIDALLAYSESIGLPAALVTSYDTRGRFNLNDFMQFKKSMEYFGDRVNCISMLLSIPNIKHLLSDKDPYFKQLYNQGKYIYFDYYMPDQTAHIQSPSDALLYEVFVFLAKNYPNVDPIKSWINNRSNYASCRTSKLVMPDGTRCQCGNLVQDEKSIVMYKSKIEVRNNATIEQSFLEKYNCASCEYHARCSMGCFMQHDYKFREELDECVYKKTLRFIDENGISNVH